MRCEQAVCGAMRHGAASRNRDRQETRSYCCGRCLSRELRTSTRGAFAHLCGLAIPMPRLLQIGQDADNAQLRENGRVIGPREGECPLRAATGRPVLEQGAGKCDIALA